MSANFIDVGSVVYGEIGPDPLITCPFPSAPLFGDDLLMLVYGGTTIDPDWELLASGIFNDSALSPAGSSALYYKKSDGTESGLTVQIDPGAIGSAYAARMYQFRGTRIKVEDVQTNETGDGAGTIQWDALSINGGDRTLIAFVCQALDSSPGTPPGYTAAAAGESTINDGAVIFAMDCNYILNQSTAPAVTTSGGPTEGWITFHLSLFTPAGRSFIVN